MTLLVVGISGAFGNLGRYARARTARTRFFIASYAISFIVTGLYWLGYHRQLHFMERFDGGALVIDLLFLMSVAFLPFPTLLLNNYSGSVSVIFYASSMATTGILLGTLWIYSGRRGLLRTVDARLNSYYTLRALYAPLIFLLSIPVAVLTPRAATYSWILVVLGRPILRRVAYR